MQRLVSSVVCAAFLLALPATALGQSWTKEQQEVWNRVQACVGYFTAQNVDAVMDCIHDDFVGWLYGEPVPRGKNNFRTIGKYFMENVRVSASEMRPVSIMVRGDFAIVHYYGFNVYEGSMDVVQDKWTDILVREGGVWRWIADHGGTLKN